MNAAEAYDRYQNFIQSIDVSTAGSDDYGDLRWHIDCSATSNAESADQATYWTEAYDTAVMILDCWTDFYPQLIK